MKINFMFFMIASAISLLTLPALGEEIIVPNANKTTLSLENIKTVKDVNKWLSDSVGNLSTNNTTTQKIYLEAGNKILELAKTDDDKKKGYQYKFNALSKLAQLGEKGVQENLDTLTKKLEADEKLRSIIYDAQFINFIYKYNIQNKHDVEIFKKNLKTWLNKPYVTHKLVLALGLRRIKTFAFFDNDIKNDPEYSANFINDLADFVKSPENTLPENIKKEILEQIEPLTRTTQGKYLNLYGTTIEDKEFNWSLLRGKYVVIQFTAIGCGPCNDEIPDLIAAYEKYKDKGLEIISVYIWDNKDNEIDKNVEIVKKFTAQEKLTWTIISETLTQKNGQPKQSEYYGIQGVPTVLLIDKNGKIIDAKARGQQLQKKLKEIFE
ncbi:MAG: TlpA family protein disulfide reductase [Planctomycetaceae bacterium]|nr:TlpA family protein disulfide reductase [Planctomycetaceae bacterium]